MLLTYQNAFNNDWIRPLSMIPEKSADTPPRSVESHETIVFDLDSASMQALADGDRTALAEIVTRWQLHLINFFYRSTSNRSDAEDLTQETFVELYKSAARYNAQNNFKAFLFTVARRRLIDSYRKKSRRPLQYIDPQDFTMQQQTETVDTTSEIEEAFQIALADLPENHRNAILMRQQQELSYEEIAQALDASISAVKTWIHRARQHLREALKEYHHLENKT